MGYRFNGALLSWNGFLLLFVVAFGLVGCGTPRHEMADENLQGVLVEKVEPGFALDRAGLEAGDRLTSWRRQKDFLGRAASQEGELRDPFDWWVVEMEQSRRGPVELFGERAGRKTSWLLDRGSWEGRVTPLFPAAFLEAFQAGQLAWAELQGKSSVGPDAAQEHWRKLEASESNRSQRAWLAWRLGDGWRDRQQWEAAEESYQFALELVQRPEARLPIWRSLAGSYRGKRDFALAREATGKMKELCRALGEDSLCLAHVATYSGYVAVDSSSFEEAKRNFDDSMARLERWAPGSFGVADNLRGLGVIQARRGNLNLAEELWVEAREVFQSLGKDSLGEARVAHNLSIIHSMRGNLMASREAAYEALRIHRARDPESLWIAHSLGILGIVAKDRGDLVEADRYAKQAMEFWEGRKQQTLTAGIIHNNRGVVLAERGDLKGASKHLLRSLEITQSLVPDGIEVALCYSRLGELARSAGDFPLAQSYLHRDLELQERIAPRSLSIADTLESLGLLSSDLEEPEAAKAYHLRALDIRQEAVPGGLPEAHSLRNLGILALEDGDLDEARKLQADALEIYRELVPESEEAAETWLELAKIARASKAPQGIRQLTERALGAMEEVSYRIGKSQMSRLRFRGKKKTFFDQAVLLLLQSDSPREAFHVLERSRSRTFLEMLAERELIFSAELPEELDRERRQLAIRFDQAQEQLFALGRKRNREQVEGIQAQLAALRGEADDLEERIRIRSARLAGLQYPVPLDFRGVRDTLDGGSVMVAFHVSEDRVHVFVVVPGRELTVHHIPLGEKRLRGEIAQFRQALEETDEAGLDRQIWYARHLYQQLLEPVESRLADARRIVLLPDGPLHYLPFGALIRDDPAAPLGRLYLAQWKPLHLAASATVYGELKKDRQRGFPGGRKAEPIAVAAVGDPVYQRLRGGGDSSGNLAEERLRSVTERGFFDWVSLPHSRREAQRISELYSQSQLYLGSEATEDLVKGRLVDGLGTGSKVIHFATHGFTDDRMPMNSGLVFSTPETFSENQENGLLQVWEIYQSVRFDADLVVLSACQTGLGEVMGGEGLVGLTRAFQFAGARSVLASLWNVADEATAELMIRFHQHLSSGETKDAALRLAQMDLAQGPVTFEGTDGKSVTRDFTSPYYWAAFQLMGDWQ
ncbi:MAG: CHAT domain-containing protein [Deltaproteobacteria bacterium]|nr:CHAT domain-containing protein [Deltaproteobacteria bacterium]